jgi:hypothetical protein
MRMRACLVFSFLTFAAAAWAGDQETEERLRQLEEQNREILERLKQSEGKNTKLEGEVERLRSVESQMLQEEVENYLDVTRALEGAAPAGTQTKKGAFVTLYGFLRFDAYYNTARFDSVIIPTRVIAEDGVAADANDDQFAMDVRLTRIGFDFNFGKVGSADATGKLEIDFANFPSGPAESRPTPRIRLAYTQIENTKWWIRLGQDWDVASPLFPTVNSETLMWNAGNPGDRRPQAEFFWKGSGSVTIQVALGLQGAVNNQDLDAGAPPFTSTERDGFDAGWPNFEIRGAWTSAGERKVVVGVWGYIGGNETDTSFGGETDFLSAMAGADFTVPIGPKFVVRGEVWWAQAGGDIRANAGQTINTATGDEIQGWGGWIELKFLQNERWNWYAGTTVDDPDNGDLAGTGTTENFTAYLGVVRMWTKTFRTGFDATFWETLYGNTTRGNGVRLNFYAVMDF